MALQIIPAKEVPLKLYERSEEIGSGAFGMVFSYHLKEENKDKDDLPRKIAVKLVHTQCITTMRKVNLCNFVHKNIVAFYGVEEVQHNISIKMEMANCNLARFQDDVIKGPVIPSDFRHLALQIAEGLEYLHGKDFAHRHIKPANILVFWDGKAMLPEINAVILKLCDFGLSSQSKGTLECTAPEVVSALTKGDKANHVDYKRADIFSLGMVFYHLLFNKMPFTQNELAETFSLSIERYKNSVGLYELCGNEGLDILLTQMLARSSADRISINRVVQTIQSLIKLSENKLPKPTTGPIRPLLGEYGVRNQLELPNQSRQVSSGYVSMENVVAHLDSSLGCSCQCQRQLHDLGLSCSFIESFSDGKNGLFGDSESDLGWIELMMTDTYLENGASHMESLPKATGLEILGFNRETAAEYGDFIENNHFKYSEDLLGWALLKIRHSGFFDPYSGNAIKMTGELRMSGSVQVEELVQNGIGTMRYWVRMSYTLPALEFENAMGSLNVPNGFSLWFHATTRQSARHILDKGILLQMGKERRDFSTSSKKGFYVCNSATFAHLFCQRYHESSLSIIVFQISDDLITNKENGLELQFKYEVRPGQNGAGAGEHVYPVISLAIWSGLSMDWIL